MKALWQIMLASASTRSTPARGSLSPPRNLPRSRIPPRICSHRRPSICSVGLLCPAQRRRAGLPSPTAGRPCARRNAATGPGRKTGRRGKPCKRRGLGSRTKGKIKKKKKAHQAPKINYNRGRALADRTLMEAKTVDPAAIWRGASASWWHETRRTDSVDFLVVITTTTHRAQAEPTL